VFEINVVCCLVLRWGSAFHRLLGTRENRDKKSFECFPIRLCQCFIDSEAFSSSGVVVFRSKLLNQARCFRERSKRV